MLPEWLMFNVDEWHVCSVVEILELFNHPSEELKMALSRHVDLFNPRDYNWAVSFHDRLIDLCIDCMHSGM